MKEEFADRVNNKCDGNEDWCNLKRKLLDVIGEVGGKRILRVKSKGKPRHFET